MTYSIAMAGWVEPDTIFEWIKRAFSLLNLGTVLLLSFLVISEFRFDWAEKLLGGYLVTTNGKRPESGAVWIKGRETRTALKKLDRIVTDRLSSQHGARGAESFAELAAGLVPGQWVMLSPDHFRKMYLKLPASLSREVMDPLLLIGLYTENKWDRVYYEKKSGELFAYLLDNGNRVLKQVAVGKAILSHVDEAAGPVPGGLGDYPAFTGMIPGGTRFLRALETLPGEVRRELMPRPLSILKSGGRILRVGISDEAKSGYVALGFELGTERGTRVLTSEARTWAVRRLTGVLAAMGEPVEER